MEMFVVRLVAILAVMQSVCFAEVKAVLKGPESSEPGDLVVLDGAESKGDNIKFLIDDALVGRTFQFGRQVIFATRTPGNYRFQVIVADKEAQIDVATLVVKVGEPEPPKPPTPPQPPQPPLPPVDIDSSIKQSLESGFASRKYEAGVWSGLLYGLARAIEQDAMHPGGPKLKTMSDIDRLRNLVVKAPPKPVSGGDVIAQSVGSGIAKFGLGGEPLDQGNRRSDVAKLLIGSASVLEGVSR